MSAVHELLDIITYPENYDAKLHANIVASSLKRMDDSAIIKGRLARINTIHISVLEIEPTYIMWYIKYKYFKSFDRTVNRDADVITSYIKVNYHNNQIDYPDFHNYNGPAHIINYKGQSDNTEIRYQIDGRQILLIDHIRKQENTIRVTANIILYDNSDIYQTKFLLDAQEYCTQTGLKYKIQNIGGISQTTAITNIINHLYNDAIKSLIPSTILNLISINDSTKSAKQAWLKTNHQNQTIDINTLIAALNPYINSLKLNEGSTDSIIVKLNKMFNK